LQIHTCANLLTLPKTLTFQNVFASVCLNLSAKIRNETNPLLYLISFNKGFGATTF